MSPAPGNQPLYRGEKVILGVFALGLLAFAGLSEIRSCFLKERHTDFTVYARAAWAVRAGHDMYQVMDDHGWHYCYPPPFALLLTPLADPPRGVDRAGFVPFWVAAAIWIVISILLSIWTVHVLARAVLPDAIPWTRRWLYARTAPLTLCLGGIGFTVSHGQVNTAVAALIAGTFAAAAAGKRFTSGIWLAGAAALKITPGLLLLYPLVRRDGRSLAGFAFGSVVLLILFPAAFFGFRGAVNENLKILDQVLTPATTGDGDQTRAKELTNTLATDSSSFVAVIHNWKNPQPAWHRPPNADPSTRLAHWAIAGTMIVVTALAIGLKKHGDAADQLLLLGSLALVMILTSPVSHNHHFAMALPALCGMWLKGVQNRPGRIVPSFSIFLPLVAWTAGTAVLLFPVATFVMLREFGLGTAVTVLLWASVLVAASRNTVAATQARPESEPLLRAA